MSWARPPLEADERDGRRGWPLLAVAVAGPAGLSLVELSRVLLLVSQKREEQVGPGFYEFEANGTSFASAALFADVDALVAADYLLKEWVPAASWSVFRPSDAGRAWAAEFRRRVRKEALTGLEDSVAWVTEQSHLDRVHKTSTVRVIG